MAINSKYKLLIICPAPRQRPCAFSGASRPRGAQCDRAWPRGRFGDRITAVMTPTFGVISRFASILQGGFVVNSPLAGIPTIGA